MIIKELKDLVEISNYYGKQKAYVIAGGGNTSYKDNKNLWVKGSGIRLDDITVDGFVQLDRNKLDVISKNNYSKDPLKREQEVKSDLINAILKTETNMMFWYFTICGRRSRQRRPAYLMIASGRENRSWYCITASVHSTNGPCTGIS